MAITTYSELQTAVANWLAKSNLTDRTPEFIALCEANLNRRLRTKEMETRATATMTASTAYLEVPDNFGGVRRIAIQGSPELALDYVAPAVLDRIWASTETSKPEVYTIEGGEFRFAPTPDSAYVCEINYYKKVPALSDAATTNWLLTSHPDIYLFGSLAEAEAFLMNDSRVALWKSRYEEALLDIQKQDRRDRWSGVPIRMRVSGGTP